MQCNCSPIMIVDLKLSQAFPFWGYKHKDNDLWIVKKWTLFEDLECDLCHARKELENGNSFIVKISPYPIWALSNYQAIDILENIEKNQSDSKIWRHKYYDFRFSEILDE